MVNRACCKFSNWVKTIFFTISSPLVYRNLFFFPGSVFDKLKKLVSERPNLQFVFLVQKKDLEKYKNFLHDSLNENFLVEAVKVFAPSSFLEKFFYFFYSYFIYTGTTRTLATLGMRPDEPPAGGKRWLASLKILIAKTFGRSKFLRKKIVPWLYHKIFKSRPFAELFLKYNPSLIFASHIYGQYDIQLLAEADLRKVKTVGMTSNWDHFDKYYLPLRPDFLLAQSEQIKNFAIKYQSYDSENIAIIGYPHFDFITDHSHAVLREQILRELGFPFDAKFILYVSGSAYSSDEPDTIEKILEWADKKELGGSTYLVIRPYLGGRGADRDFDEAKFNRFEEHSRVRFYKKEFWGDLSKSIQFFNIMRHADVVISMYSTIVIEAAALDKPLVGIGFDGYKKRRFAQSVRRFMLREHFQDVLNSCAVRTAYSFPELKEILKKYLDNPSLDHKSRMLMIQRLADGADGKAGERIIEHILKHLA